MDNLIQYLKTDEVFQDYLKNERDYYEDDDTLIIDYFCEYLEDTTMPVFNNIYRYKGFFISFDVIYDTITDIEYYTKQEVLDILENIKKEVENDIK
jgi:hypothetical protein